MSTETIRLYRRRTSVSCFIEPAYSDYSALTTEQTGILRSGSVIRSRVGEH